MTKKLPDFVAIGYVERAHGIGGEVRVKPTTVYPPRFKELKTVFLERPQGGIEEVEIIKTSVRGQIIYLKFKGVDTREQALALKGATINIKREDCLPLQDGQFYHFELIGLKVKTTTGQQLGYVEDVWELPANAVIVVKDEHQEYLIPAIKDVIREVDLEREEIVIYPMDGLLQ